LKGILTVKENEMFTLTRTFCETIILNTEDCQDWLPSSKRWEIEIEVHGSIDPGEPQTWNNPGTPETIQVYGLEVKSATVYDFEGQGFAEIGPRQIEWIDARINRAYWFGIMPEGYLEELVQEATAFESVS